MTHVFNQFNQRCSRYAVTDPGLIVTTTTRWDPRVPIESLI